MSSNPTALDPDATAALRDAAVAQRSIELLETLVAGTAAATGRDFFRSLAKHTAATLGARYSFVAECLPRNRSRALAFWSTGDFAPEFEYDWTDAPCANVLRGEICHYEDGVQQLFPADADLVTLGARSYLGVPIQGSGREVIGHLVVIDDRPMRHDPLAVGVLTMFANRAGAELERLRADASLRQLNAEMEVLLEVNRAICSGLERDELFDALAHCLHRVLGHDRFGIELPIEGDRLQGHLVTPGGPAGQRTRIKVLPARGTACDWVLTHREWLVSGSRLELRERFPGTFEVMAEEGWSPWRRYRW